MSLELLLLVFETFCLVFCDWLSFAIGLQGCSLFWQCVRSARSPIHTDDCRECWEVKVCTKDTLNIEMGYGDSSVDR